MYKYLSPLISHRSFLTSYSFLLFCFLLFATLPSIAQTEKPPLPKSMQTEAPGVKKKPKFTTGGGFGFQFGAYFNTIEVSPQVGVYATPWLHVVANAQYSYMWRRSYYNSHVWGLGIALEPIIIKKIVTHVGYEFSQLHFKWLDGSPKQVENFHYVVLGGGYKQYISQRIYFQALILFNIPLNQPTIQNYYYNYYPFFRVGIGVDL
ncbi:MAG: hypothetical protein FWC10_03580 [Lentimicrobiaceae bacterium]|nr:hypothetical protein [Lentimicrobiaceae bacterium]